MRAPPALALFPALLLALAVHPVGAQAPGHDPDKTVAAGGALPDGWSARADQGTTANAKVVPMGTGIHVTLGPAIILYRESSKGSGPFHTLATFTQTKAPGHPEGYGLFYGGRALDSASEQYTYFLVRGDGTYLVKRRDGQQTTEISKGWVPSPAVHKADAKGVATNLLEIDHKSDAGKIVYRVNGEPVLTADAKGVDVNGIVGLRINHNLDVHVDGFAVHR